VQSNPKRKKRSIYKPYLLKSQENWGRLEISDMQKFLSQPQAPAQGFSDVSPPLCISFASRSSPTRFSRFAAGASPSPDGQQSNAR
jgi:hypothetical protein